MAPGAALQPGIPIPSRLLCRGHHLCLRRRHHHSPMPTTVAAPKPTAAAGLRAHHRGHSDSRGRAGLSVLPAVHDDGQRYQSGRGCGSSIRPYRGPCRARHALDFAIIDPGSANFSRTNTTSAAAPAAAHHRSETHVRHALDLAARRGFSPGLRHLRASFARPPAPRSRGRPASKETPIYRLMFCEGLAVGFPQGPTCFAAHLSLLEEEAGPTPWMIAAERQSPVRSSPKRSRAAASAFASRLGCAVGHPTSNLALVEEAVQIVRDHERNPPRQPICGRRSARSPEAPDKLLFANHCLQSGSLCKRSAVRSGQNAQFRGNRRTSALAPKAEFSRLMSARRKRARNDRLLRSTRRNALHRDLDGLRDIQAHASPRPCPLDIHRIGSRAQRASGSCGTGRCECRIPSIVPGAADDLAQPGVFDRRDRTIARGPIQRPLAQRRALMGAAVQQAEELALDVEDRDRPSVDLKEFRVPGSSSSTGAITCFVILLSHDLFRKTGAYCVQDHARAVNLLRIVEIERLLVGVADAGRQHARRFVIIPMRVVGREQQFVPADPLDQLGTGARAVRDPPSAAWSTRCDARMYSDSLRLSCGAPRCAATGAPCPAATPATGPSPKPASTITMFSFERSNTPSFAGLRARSAGTANVRPSPRCKSSASPRR